MKNLVSKGMKMARKRKNYYFTKVHEQAIIDYCSTEDYPTRNKLYEEFIGPVFDEMVDKIVFTYKFTTLPNIDTLREDRERNEFFNHLKGEVDSWKEMPLRANEQKTIQAIQILFENSDNIEIFNKKAIYLYIREITGLNTKQVVSSLNKIRKRYREFKSEWDNE